jgi:hypothetical protein
MVGQGIVFKTFAYNCPCGAQGGHRNTWRACWDFGYLYMGYVDVFSVDKQKN